MALSYRSRRWQERGGVGTQTWCFSWQVLNPQPSCSVARAIVVGKMAIFRSYDSRTSRTSQIQVIHPPRHRRVWVPKCNIPFFHSFFGLGLSCNFHSTQKGGSSFSIPLCKPQKRQLNRWNPWSFGLLSWAYPRRVKCLPNEMTSSHTFLKMQILETDMDPTPFKTFFQQTKIWFLVKHFLQWF